MFNYFMDILVLIINSIVGTIAGISILSTGMVLFRIPIQKFFMYITISAFASFHFNLFVFAVLKWAEFEPFLAVLFLALMIQLIVKVGMLYSLMMAFIGSLCYTIVYAVVIFMTEQLTGDDLATLFHGTQWEIPMRLFICVLMGIFAYFVSKQRWGFTFVKGYDTNAHNILRQRKLFAVLAGAFFLFSIAYYAVTLHIMMILWIGLGLFVLLAIIISLLYKKEMEEL